MLFAIAISAASPAVAASCRSGGGTCHLRQAGRLAGSHWLTSCLLISHVWTMHPLLPQKRLKNTMRVPMVACGSHTSHTYTYKASCISISIGSCSAIERSANICLKQASYKPQYIHLFSYKMLYWYMQCTHASSTCIQNIYLCLSATNPLVYFKFHEFFRNIFLKLFDIYFHTNCVCFSIDKSFVWHRFPCENTLTHTHTYTRLCCVCVIRL